MKLDRSDAVSGLVVPPATRDKTATRYLLDCGFRLDPWINFLMSDRPMASFDRFIGFGARFASMPLPGKLLDNANSSA